MFVMLVGSSGVGKNTLINSLKETNEKLVLMPTLTTRSIRSGEVEGNPFYFLTKEEFQQKIKDKELFEHELIHGNYYGSSKKIFTEYLAAGNVLIKDIGVEGAANLSRILKEKTKTIKVFLTTINKGVLIRRLKARGEKDIKKRLKRYSYEQAQKYKSDFVILNQSKKQTVDLLKEILLNQNKLENIKFSLAKEKLNQNKIKTLVDEYKTKQREEDYIKVFLKEGKIYLLSRPEKLVASLIAGVDIAKKVVKPRAFKALSMIEQEKWQEYLKELTNK